MKLFPLALAALLLQAGSDPTPVAEPAHFHFLRPLKLAANTGGTTCVTLDATTYAHSKDRSLSDLRLLRDGRDETPFALTESSTANESEHATVRNAGTVGGLLSFDLAMPARPYSAVELELALKDFVGTADVTGLGLAHDAAPVHLGTLTLFDLSSQHLSRSTNLALAEETFPTLHITLRLAHPDGTALPADPHIIGGATIPPSREAQTVYVAVASTVTFRQQGHDTVATLSAPAHVPIERVRFTLAPDFKGNFLREVAVRSQAPGDSEPEQLSGEISRVLHPAPFPGAPAVHAEHLDVDAVLASNLQHPTGVELRIANADDAPLPLRSVELEMRQRRLCFDAQPGARYALAYGDDALAAPVYDYARLFTDNTPAAGAWLAPEEPNPHFTPRADTRPFTERHPELLWIALLAVVALLGAIALSNAKHQSGRH